MLRPEHLKQIDEFIDNLNFTKLFNRFKKEEECDPKIQAAKDAIKDRQVRPPVKRSEDLYHPKSLKEYDTMYGNPDDGCFTDMSDYH
jgi:hypothetical protein